MSCCSGPPAEATYEVHPAATSAPARSTVPRSAPPETRRGTICNTAGGRPFGRAGTVLSTMSILFAAILFGRRAYYHFAIVQQIVRRTKPTVSCHAIGALRTRQEIQLDIPHLWSASGLTGSINRRPTIAKVLWYRRSARPAHASAPAASSIPGKRCRARAPCGRLRAGRTATAGREKLSGEWQCLKHTPLIGSTIHTRAMTICYHRP